MSYFYAHVWHMAHTLTWLGLSAFHRIFLNCVSIRSTPFYFAMEHYLSSTVNP